MQTDRNLPMQTNGDRGNQLATKNNCKVVFIAASYTSLQQIYASDCLQPPAMTNQLVTEYTLFPCYQRGTEQSLGPRN